MKQVLNHPFVSGLNIHRLPGDKAEYDIFLSYRVDSDTYHAQMIYNTLTSMGIKVWWDKECLKPGEPWQIGFCKGLYNSRIFIPLLSKDAINHDINSKHNLSKIHENSIVDHLLLEYLLSLEFQLRGFIDKIYPIFLGRVQYNNEYGDYFKDESHPRFERSVIVESLYNQFNQSLEQLNLGSAIIGRLAVNEIIQHIISNQGSNNCGSLGNILERVTTDVLIMINECKNI